MPLCFRSATISGRACWRDKVAESVNVKHRLARSAASRHARVYAVEIRCGDDQYNQWASRCRTRTALIDRPTAMIHGQLDAFVEVMSAK